MKSLAVISFLLAASIVLSGCAPLLIAGGVVGGYAIAKSGQDNRPPTASK